MDSQLIYRTEPQNRKKIKKSKEKNERKKRLLSHIREGSPGGREEFTEVKRHIGNIVYRKTTAR